MEYALAVIDAAYRIESQLGQLAAALTDEDLRDQVLAVQSNMRPLVYRIGAFAVGAETKSLQAPTKKRGRPRKTEQDTPARMAEDGSTSVSTSQA